MNHLKIYLNKYVDNEFQPATKKLFRILLLSFFLFNSLYLCLAYKHFFGDTTYGVIKHFDPKILSDWLYYLLWNPRVSGLKDIFIIAHIIFLLAALFNKGGKSVLIAAYLFTMNVNNLNLSMLDGGHNLLSLLFFLLIFMNSGGKKLNPTSLAQRILVVISNSAFFLARVQVVTLYFSAVMHKLQGQLWTRGVALYYILQNDEFKHPFWSSIIIKSDFIITVGTYATLAFQLAYPFLIWPMKSRPFMLLVVLSFHLSTIYLMGLTTFGLGMFVANSLFLKEEWAQFILDIPSLILQNLETLRGNHVAPY